MEMNNNSINNNDMFNKITNLDSNSVITQDITAKLNHRFKLIEKLDEDLHQNQKKISISMELGGERIKKDISEFKEELKDLNVEIDKLLKTIYCLGSELKTKVSGLDFDEIKTRVDNWKLEEFIQKKELEKTFNRYAEE